MEQVVYGSEDDLPKYLKERGKEEKIIRVARFRMGNEMRKERYWERVRTGGVDCVDGRRNHGNM